MERVLVWLVLDVSVRLLKATQSMIHGGLNNTNFYDIYVRSPVHWTFVRLISLPYKAVKIYIYLISLEPTVCSPFGPRKKFWNREFNPKLPHLNSVVRWYNPHSRSGCQILSDKCFRRPHSQEMNYKTHMQITLV